MPSIPAHYNCTASRYTAAVGERKSIDAPDRDALRRAFDLLVECCRQCFATPDQARLAVAIAQVDWALFLALARRHRVEGLAAEALRSATASIPAATTATLARESERIAHDGLASAVECNRLNTSFADAGIKLLFVKGLSLARLAYRKPFVKMGWDIDLLVDPVDVSQAVTMLDRLGYHALMPADEARIVRWHRTNKESVWRCGDHFVELHSHLADNPRIIPTITVHSPRQSVEIVPGVVLPTLAPDALFAYLTVHGGSSNWFRLKWASDLAALVQDCDATELVRLVTLARNLAPVERPLRPCFFVQHSSAERLSRQPRCSTWLMIDAIAGWPHRRCLNWPESTTISSRPSAISARSECT